MLQERRLHRMQLSALCQPLDGRNLIALMHDGERQACIHPPSVHVHGACPTLPVVASLLRAKEVQMLPQRIQQRHPRLQLHSMLLAIHLEDHWHSPRDANRSRCRCWRLYFLSMSRM
jgi:hypothetical protein